MIKPSKMVPIFNGLMALVYVALTLTYYGLKSFEGTVVFGAMAVGWVALVSLSIREYRRHLATYTAWTRERSAD